MTSSEQAIVIGAHTMGDFVMLDAEQRRRHLYVVGQTGTGKSTLLLNLVAQDLDAGAGLALLDPHGDLALAALAQLPKSRTNDLVYLDPADSSTARSASIPSRWSPTISNPLLLTVWSTPSTTSMPTAGDRDSILHPDPRRSRAVGHARRHPADAAPIADR